MENLTMVTGLEDTRVGKAVVLTDESADILIIGHDLGISGGGKVVLVAIVYFQADLFASNPWGEKIKKESAIISRGE
jgi:hypothetical protein